MPLEASLWVELGRAGRGAALERLHKYAAPLAEFARRRGKSAAEAEALAQAALETVSAPEFLDAAARQRLAFRPALFAMISKSLDPARGWTSIREDGSEVLAVRPETDAEFDRAWALALLRRALEAVEREAPRLGETVSLHYGQGRPLSEVAARTGRAAREETAEARRRLKLLLRAGLEEYVGSIDEFDAELAALLRRL